ncbi:MAG: FecR family protein, partial [Spirochaetota bacterium]|nr:FecR family protein [Spirochaetota bacterium]
MKKILILLLLTAVSFSLFAQYGTPVAILEYFDDDLEIEITGADGFALEDIYYGMGLEAGDTIRTERTGAELRLDPNGSIIKLSPFTVFTIEKLQQTAEDSNDFNLVSGKIRAIAARAGYGEKYQIRTQSAVCGVRGTDFGVISIPGSQEKAFVVDGLIDYTNTLTMQKIELGSGMVGDALAEVFQAIAVSAEQMNDLVKDVLFEQLDPGVVPGHGEPEELVEEEEETKETEEQTAESQEPVEEEPKELSEKEIAESAMMKAISDMLGLEIGTVTIDGDTYSKAIIQPTFNVGKLKLSLYLPIVYQTDLFDPEDWYQPEGNNEWSFGADQD